MNFCFCDIFFLDFVFKVLLSKQFDMKNFFLHFNNVPHENVHSEPKNAGKEIFDVAEVQ